MTNTGSTTTSGAVGVSTGTDITGFPPGIAGGGTHSNDASAIAAQADNLIAFGALDQDCTKTYSGTKDLVGANLKPGVYCADAFALSGTLTLSGSGVWIFKSASDLITSGTAKVVGSDPCDVWWRVASSATLGTGTSLIGNILALTSIWLRTGAKLNGRALAQTGEVTLDNNTITGLICLTAGQTATPTNTRLPSTQTAAAKTATAKAKATARAEGAAETQAAETPVVPGLPGTGGVAPIRNENLPWSLAMVGGLSAIALALGVRAFRRTYRPKQ